MASKKIRPSNIPNKTNNIKFEIIKSVNMQINTNQIN